MTPDEPDLRNYLGWLQKTAGNMIGFGHADLDDLIQEGYIAMWRATRTYDPGKGALPAWLTARAHWRMLEVVMRKRTVAAEELTDDSLAAPDLLVSMELAYHHGEIGDAISHLTPQQKRYVIARFWCGLSHTEMQALDVFTYDPSGLWNSRKNGARWKLEAELQHLAPTKGSA